MESKEISMQMQMTYAELISYLKQKYGVAPFDYFRNPSFKSKNPKVSRGSEGLACHHIDEDKAIMISSPKQAPKYPFEWQKADRLVYCNYMEHLILHIKIAEEPRHPDAMPHQLPGIGGAVNFIIPEMNDYFNGYKFSKKWMLAAFELIKDNYEDYLNVLKYLWRLINKDERYTGRYSIEKMSMGWQMKPYKNILKELSNV